jgi:NAD(P)-dependent dehydrogenase (short-subunit alcohol dehydrogenase family)
MSSEQKNALIIGAYSAIAQALASALIEQNTVTGVIAVSRTPADNSDGIRYLVCNHESEQITAIAAQLRREQSQLARVFICTGVLHDDSIQPEKSLLTLDPVAMMEVFRINCVIPSLWLKALLPLLRTQPHCVLTALSARVGSITDNHKGGWYSYRSSKAALNMVLKTAAIEFARVAPGVKLLSFHPGTVDTPMSRPFQKHVSPEALFTPEFVAKRLISITNTLQPDGQLSYLDWQGNPVPW